MAYNHINTSKLSDCIPSGEVSPTSVLPNKDDRQRIFNEVLVSLALLCRHVPE